MGGFNTIKKSRKRSHEIEEKLNVLNRELEKTKNIQEQPTMHTSGIIVKSENQTNQDHSDFESKSFGGEGLGFSGADGNTAGNASIGDYLGVSGVALSPPHPVTGVRVSASHVRDGLGGTTPLRPGVTITRGFSDNPPSYTMGSCLWFYDSDYDNGVGVPAGKWCNLEYSNFDDTAGQWFFWDTIKSGQFAGIYIVNTDLSQHPCGDISSLIDDLNFPGEGGAIGSAFNTVMTQQSLDDPGSLLIDIKDLAVQAFNYLKDKAEDFFGAFAMPVEIATSVGKNEPVNAPEPSESEIDEFFDNLDPNNIFNPDDPFNIQTNGVPVNNEKQNYADENIYVDENGNVQSNIGPNGEKEYYETNNTAPASEGSTVGSRGQAQSQVYQNENGEWMFSYEDHAYHNINSTDEDETINVATKASEIFHRNADERFGREGGEVQFPGTSYETKKPDNTSPNTGAMSNYPCNSTACIRGDSIQKFEIPVSEIKNQEIKNAINAAIAAGNKQNESYIPESIKLGHFEPKVLDVDIKQLRKNIKPEFPKDPPPEMIDGYSAKSRLAPKKIKREPFIKITKKDLAQNHKLTDKEISDFMNDVKMINDYIKENPADLIHAQLRYPKHDPRLAQLNWQMDQMLDASKKYVDRQFPENQNLFNKIKEKIKNTIDQTDPKNFKPIKDPIKYVDVNKKKKLKETLTRHFNKPVKSKSIFGLNMSEVRKTNQKMIEKREQERKVKEEERAYIQEKMENKKSNWKESFTNVTVGMKVGQTFVHNPSGQTVTTAGALGGVETISSTVSIFGDEIPGPDASQYGLQGYAKPMNIMKRKDPEDTNKKLDASQEFAKKVNADVMMNARVKTGELSLEQKKEFVEIYKNSMEDYNKKSIEIDNENRRRIKANISKVKSFVGSYGQKLSDSYPSGSSDVRIAQGGKTLLVISHSGFNYDDSKKFNVRVYEAEKGKRISKVKGNFGYFSGSIADNPFNKRKSSGQATIMYKGIGAEVENKTFSIKEVPQATMPTPPKFMQKNMDKGWQPSATSSFDQEFINKMNTWFNTIPTGGANFPAKLAINLAKGNLDPVTNSPGPAITNLIKQNILDNLKKGNSKSDKLGTNSYWDSKSGKGAIRYDMYKFGDSIQAAKMAPVSASLGQYSIERTDKGIRIVDTYDISGGFTSPGGAAIFDPLTKLIGGRDVQSTGETLTAIAARRAAELGYDMVDADSGKTLRPVYSGEEEFNSRNYPNSGAPTIATPKGFNIKIDFTIPWSSFSPETTNLLKIGGSKKVNPLQTDVKTKRQSLSLDEPIVRRKKKRN